MSVDFRIRFRLVVRSREAVKPRPTLNLGVLEVTAITEPEPRTRSGAQPSSTDRQFWRGSSSVHLSNEDWPDAWNAFEFVLPALPELEA
jgi:hypothetical protein